MLDHTAPLWLARLLTWLEAFEDDFRGRAQRGGLRRYVQGVLSDSRRKSMEAMWQRLSDPGSYQALQYFITEASWNAEAVWRRLRAVIPAREGVLVLDGTGFPKQGTASVGVNRQYSGTLGKVGNCQVGVTAALWTGSQAWLVGAQLYLPKMWLTTLQRIRGRIPSTIQFREKWRQALTLLRQVRAAGMTITAVVADAEFGDCTTCVEPCTGAACRMRWVSRRTSKCFAERRVCTRPPRRWDVAVRGRVPCWSLGSRRLPWATWPDRPGRARGNW